MLEIHHGKKRNALAADQLVRVLTELSLDGALYLGYPIFASLDETIHLDATLVCRQHGLVAFDFDTSIDSSDNEEISNRQDTIYASLYQKLISSPNARRGRGLPFEIQIVTFAPTSETLISSPELQVVDSDGLVGLLEQFKPMTDEDMRNVNAVIQRVTTLKPTRRRSSVKMPDSRGAIMKRIEREIANLDKWQNAAAIETPEGVQRIRGLAGSGKTIVLALKAAYLHAANPQWRIAVTFQTRSLYQQFSDLIRRFTFEQTHDEPDPERLRILHAWGSSSDPGLYSELALAHECSPKDFNYGRSHYGYDRAFEGVCRELLDEIRGDDVAPVYDAILIDEAQDFPQSFFELAYVATKPPHRVVYAYDELQNLGDYDMSPPSELFGNDETGMIRVPELSNIEGEPKRDIVLPVCYRNTPWALTVAHSVGFGVYREGGLLQFFDETSQAQETGYTVTSGELEQGRRVSLRRREDSYPAYFEELLDAHDSIMCHVFANKEEQAAELADLIIRNLTEDELELRDILVILPDPLTSRTEASMVAKHLNMRDIPSHLAGVTSSRDELFKDDSVAITGIYRAKGNEAAMVYVLNSEYGYDGLELGKRRNILFTAITRSRAWVRIFGCGPRMAALKEEVDTVVKNNYELRFTVPTKPELERMRLIHRERSAEDRRKIHDTLDRLESLIDGSDVDPDNLSTQLREKLLAWLNREKESGLSEEDD